MKNVQSRLFFILYIMWFYLYLMTTSLFEQHGYHMWGYTTNDTILSNNISDYYQSKYNETVFYAAIYQMPDKYIAYPFDRLIVPPKVKFLRDEYGLEWYDIQPRFIEMICSNASIPYRMVKRNEKEKEKEKEKEERNKWYVEHDEL